MTRTILSGMFALLSVGAIGILPTSCQSGGIGDPCTPEDEYDPRFGGFKVTEENIESRSFQCQSRICLVNHFQGRVSCPLGQPARTLCDGPDDDGKCSDGAECTAAEVFAPECGDGLACPPDQGYTCNKEGAFCACDGNTQCPTGYTCDSSVKQCRKFVCHKKGDCQSPDATAEQNKGKGCCVPGTDNEPIAAASCGQCDDKGGRNALDSVYCSCRCGPADGDESEDDNFNYCDCPDGFTCSEVRKNIGLGDVQLTGKFCVKAGTETTPTEADGKCGAVAGYYQSSGDVACAGTPAAL